MPPRKFNRTVEELREVASFFWPPEISEKEAELSVIPKLIETQEQFIALLAVPVDDERGIFKVLEASTVPANLFVKHLVVLADFGGEMLQRVNSRFKGLFPDGAIRFAYNGKERVYKFQGLPIPGLNNAKLGIGGKELVHERPLTRVLKDIIVLLVFGGACTEGCTAEVLTKCEIGDYIGEIDKLEKFIKQRYIWVSRITGGSKANNLGQIVQEYVITQLKAAFADTKVKFQSNGRIPGITHTDGKTLTTFDIVATDERKYAAVEVSFQVTTNSTIERKAGQAESRFRKINSAGYRIAYLIDGAGNLLQRENATRTLCNYSHCTVAFSEPEIGVLAKFLKGYFGSRGE